MKILFLDGLGSNPTRRKPEFLRDHGFEVFYPILPEIDFEDAVRVAQGAYAGSHPDAIVGYSRGGAVALNIDSGETPLVLLAPAWTFLGAATTAKPRTLILHSERDVLVHALPLFHVHGLGNGVCCWLASGCLMRLTERFEAAKARARSAKRFASA